MELQTQVAELQSKVGIVSSSSTSDDSTSDKKTDTTNKDLVGGISQSKGNTTTSGTTSGFTDNVFDIYSNPTGSYIGK
jgi:hypothetical protein